MNQQKEKVPADENLSPLIEDYSVYIDESKAIIIKFIEQSLKDLWNQSFRFSHLPSEREYYETARDFLYGNTAIDWGGQYYNIIDWISLLRIDPDYFHDFIYQEEKKREKEYLEKIGKKKRNEIRGLFVSASKQTPFLWKKNLNERLKEIGIRFFEHRKFPDEEILEDIQKEQGENEYKNAIRKIFDYNTGLVGNSDFLILRWKSGEKESNIIHEISYAYSKLIPIYTITNTSSMKLPRNILAYSNKTFKTIDELVDFLKEKTGKKIFS